MLGFGPIGQSPLASNIQAAAAAAVPAVRVVYDLPPIGREYPQHLRTWIWKYNQNLIAQDKLPVGDEVTELPPRAYPEPATRTWIWSYNRNLIGQDSLPVGDRIYDLPDRGPIQTPLRSWTYSYNRNLIAQDALPVGQQHYDRPADAAAYPINLRTWIGVTVPPAAADRPFVQEDWPTPRPLVQPDRSFTRSFNLNLIAQDQLPVGSFHTDLPPQGPPRAMDLRTWINTVNLALTTVAAALPFNQYDWPNPRGPEQPRRGWIWKYNENLIAQDALPVGSVHTDLPPQGAIPINDLRTWINRVNLALTQAAALPFNQFDWPVRLGPPQPDRSFTASFNRNLAGQDVFPTRQMDWPLTRIVPQPDRAFVAFFNRNLIGQDKLPVGARITDLPPVGHIYPNSLRAFSHSPNPPAPVEPVIDRVSSMPFIATPGQLKSW